MFYIEPTFPFLVVSPPVYLYYTFPARPPYKFDQKFWQHSVHSRPSETTHATCIAPLDWTEPSV